MSKRSLKLSGSTTSLFLEDAYWQELQLRADERGLSQAGLLREILDQSPDDVNRSAAVKQYLLKVCREEIDFLKVAGRREKKSRWLIEKDGVRTREEFTQNQIAVGSAESNDIILNGYGVSRYHALFSFDGRYWWASDLESKEGIATNGVSKKVIKLQKNIEVDIGEYQIMRG